MSNVTFRGHAKLLGATGAKPTWHCKSCGCFPAAATVKLESGKSLKMSELQIGDQVETGKKCVKMSELQIGDRVQTGKKCVKMSELKIRD